MSVVNPNTITTTRIPSAYIATATASMPGNTDNVLRFYNGAGNPSKIVIGPTKGYSYDKSQNWRAGLTPFDNGYLNDGVSAGHTSANSTSRYWDNTLPTIFEWWNTYVIYCYGGSTTGPNGNDNLEIIEAVNSAELINKVNQMLSASEVSEFGALRAISLTDSYLCVNTNYPNIPIVGGGYSLNMLHDFGFIPCYPRGGEVSYDISNTPDRNMTFDNTYNGIVYREESYLGLNCRGGCIEYRTSTGLDFAYVPYISGLHTNNTTINIWFKVDSLVASDKYLIDTSNGWTTGTGDGYQLYINSDTLYFNLITPTGFVNYNIPGIISPNVWYNVIFTLEDLIGLGSTAIKLVVSDYNTHNISSINDVRNVSQGTNMNTFALGIKLTSPTLSDRFLGYFSLVSMYDGVLSDPDIYNLWAAYAQCTPRPDAFINGGRYRNY